LPRGLYLSAAGEREDVRDVLIYLSPSAAPAGKRGFPPASGLQELPSAATVATSSTRRQAQLLVARPDLKTAPIRGNVGTRLRKLVEQPELDAIILALAGLKRLGYTINDRGQLCGTDVPPGLFASVLPVQEMLPCVGQAALGIESRFGDRRIDEICAALNHSPTLHCVTAERAFLHAMGGGCLSPVAAYANFVGDQLRLRAVSFRNEQIRRGELSGPPENAIKLGEQMAARLA
jgi:hydroxymethylbilane synthase